MAKKKSAKKSPQQEPKNSKAAKKVDPAKRKAVGSKVNKAISSLVSEYSSTLDPRLHRLCSQMADSSRMKQDLQSGLVAMAEVAEGTRRPAGSAGGLLKRVLVSLGNDQVPEDLADMEWNRLVANYFVVSVPLGRMSALGNHPMIRYIEAGRTLSPALDTSVPETRANTVHQSPRNLRGNGVIIGVIDVGGLDFTLDDFRKSDGKSRVLFLWDQRLTPQTGELSPTGFGYGVEYDNAKLNSAISSSNPFSTVRHKPSPGSHATHVASTAAGNGRSKDASFPANKFIGTAPEADIIFVEAGTETGIGSFTDSVRVAEAVAYIYQRAQALNRPCVINMSLGQNGGSHDGESIVERAIDRLLETPGRAFVCAGGNEHVFRGHASGTLATGATRTLRWKVGGGLPLPGIIGAGVDRTRNEMEVWYSSQDEFHVSVTSPSGTKVGPVRPGETVNKSLPGGTTVFIDSIRFSPLNGDSQIYIEVNPGSGTVPSGEWQVVLTAASSRVGRFDAWIERDARDKDNSFADQSFFVGTDFDPVMTLGTPSTGRRSIAVANYDHRTESPSSSSGRGTTRDGRAKPEVAAPGTRIVAAHSLGGRANPSGGTFPMRLPMSGTSMASPHVAGIVALMLQRNPKLTAAQIQKTLIAGTRKVAGVANFDPAWGFGRADAVAAVDLVRP
jgi:subtilisin family serine protease